MSNDLLHRMKEHHERSREMAATIIALIKEGKMSGVHPPGQPDDPDATIAFFERIIESDLMVLDRLNQLLGEAPDA